MEAQLSAVEKTIEASELLEIIMETEAETGVSGMSVAGGGKEGLFVKDVLKDSPAARALRLREGDQLLSARVYFDNIQFEDALQILKCAEPYKVSFCLKRTVPSKDIARKPGTSTFEVRGPKAKMAKMNLRSLTPLKKKKKGMRPFRMGSPVELPEAEGSGAGGLPAGKLDIAPVDVEFSLPRFPKLRRAKSAGEVSAAAPSPGLSPRLSSLGTKRRKLKFPRLKVKEAAAVAAARAQRPEGQLEVALPKGAGQAGVAAAAHGEPAWKASRFAVPFARTKKPKEEARAEASFQVPQLELDLPLPKPEAGLAPPQGRVHGAPCELPRVEIALPEVSLREQEAPASGLPAALRLPVAEVSVPRVDLDLSLPKLEGPPPEPAPKEEGFRIKLPKFGVSAEEAKLALPTVKVPAVDIALGKGRDGEAPPEATRPTLDVGIPPVDLELPLPKVKAEVGLTEVSAKVPSIRLAAKPPEEEEKKLPQVEISLGRTESPKAKVKAPKIQMPGLGISLLEHKAESREGGPGPTESKAKAPAIKVPTLEISAPKVDDLQLPKAPPGRAKAEEVAEESRLKFQVPHVSLPKFDLPAKAAPPPPPSYAGLPKPEGPVGAKVDLAVPAVKLPDVRLPKVPLTKPELDIAVEKPRVEVAMPSARLSFPSAAVPALDIDLPKVGVELDLPKVEAELRGDREVTPEVTGRDLEVELCVPKCWADRPKLDLGTKTSEGPDGSGLVAKIPKVDLSLGKELPTAEGAQGAEIGLDLKVKPLPKIDLELDVPAPGAKLRPPAVEIPALTLPDVTIESTKSPETEPKLKSPKFALPKFSISGPKVRKASPEALAPEVEGPEAADKGSKLKLPKFGISFPKSKGGAEVEGPQGARAANGKTLKERLAAAFEPVVGGDSSERGVQLPTVDVEVPALEVAVALPKRKAEWPEEEAARASPPAGVELPEVKLKVPKFSLPKFGGKGKESDLERVSGEAKQKGGKEAQASKLAAKGPEKEAKAKTAMFKMPAFSAMRRDVQAPSLEAAAKTQKEAGSSEEKPKGPFGKMAKLKLSSPKVGRGGQLHIPAPSLEVSIPPIELSKARADGGLAVGAESPSLSVRVPSVELAVPCAHSEGGQCVGGAGAEATEPGIGELQAPSLGISAPKVELDFSLPSASPEESLPGAAPDTEAKVRLPKVELPRWGRGEEGAEAQLLKGPKTSPGRDGERPVDGAPEGSILGSKIRVPKVDLSFPAARLSDAELPLTEAEVPTEGPEGAFKVPLVELPKFPIPKAKVPDVELEVSLEGGKAPKGKGSGPAVRLLRFGGSSGSDAEGEGEAELDPSRLPQLELKAPKLRGSLETLSLETGAKEAKRKAPSSLPLGLGLGLSRAEAVAGAGAEESRFKVKLPSLGFSKAGAELGPDTQPLCPAAEGADVSFSLPDVGFSVGRGEKAAAGVAGLEAEVGGFDALSMRVPAVEVSGPAWGSASSAQGRRGSGGEEELEAKKGVFKVPGLELSAPSLKAHAEYDVGGAGGGNGGRKSPDAAGAGRKHKVNVPALGLALLKTSPESGQDGEGSERRPLFALGRPKAKGAEGSSGLLEGEEEAGGKGKTAKLKLKPPFALSLTKPRPGPEVNGKPEEGVAAKLKMPKLGFSKAEGPPGAAQLSGEKAEVSLQNGSHEGKGKLGKLRLPQVELSSPSKPGETDPELNLKLVRAEEAKEEAHGASGAFAALKAARFRSPKIAFSAFKKQNGEGASGAVVSSAARTEMASLESGEAGARGERSPKFKFPKLALSPRSHGALEIASEHHDGAGDDARGVRINLPSVGFSEEQDLEQGGGAGGAAEGLAAV
uniref:Periaxin n=1 Tax=Salvator merianae TaxID=96440 RepID=A0A8D0BAP7_SALMN